MVESCTAFAERDDVVDLGGCAFAAWSSDLALVVVAVEDLRSHGLPVVVVGRGHGPPDPGVWWVTVESLWVSTLRRR